MTQSPLAKYAFAVVGFVFLRIAKELSIIWNHPQWLIELLTFSMVLVMVSFFAMLGIEMFLFIQKDNPLTKEITEKENEE